MTSVQLADYIHFAYKLLLVETPHGFVEKKVLRHYLSADALVLELEGISSRQDVESLYDKKIFVHKSEIKLNEDEYLVHDLVSFEIVVRNTLGMDPAASPVGSPRDDKRHHVLGKIIGMISYGAQENLEIKMNDSNKVILYPFIDKYVHKIDYEKKQIEVEYLEEFFTV
jgi:16S rRNA processing protein RimM